MGDAAVGGLFGAAARQATTVRRLAHRPWPLPEGRWSQAQTWEDLLFAHWRVPEPELRRLIPPALELDLHDATGWLAITPFRVTGLRLRGMLPVPRVSSFLELNVRTYVSFDGKAGVYFFSLDADSPLAVEGARRLFKLPYFRADMSAERVGDRIDYASARREGPARPFVFRGRYWPLGSAREPRPGSLEHFLTERYCLYTVDERSRVCRAEIHHPPWSLQDAAAEIELNSVAPRGVRLSDDEPLLHFARRQDVVIWPLTPVDGPGATRLGTGPAAA
jgi:uncharacterized protein YqjF (DUF2071 family)